ncbi:MAG TPA: EthD family reductase [Gemmatimonadaceae bacterium]|nr:EthD family reductase [Gemmatimonadaceae bacterium]
MVKTMFFLYRRSDLSADAFQRYSKEVHIPLVARVPGLLRYVVNHAMMNPVGAEGACDGVAELWFDSVESFQAAVASAEGQKALSDQANYLDLGRTHVLFMEENVIR